MPDEHALYQKQWRELHPDWEYQLWADDDIPDDLKQIFDGTGRQLTQASKANALRLFILARHGGVYADTDIEYNKNIDSFLQCEMFAAQEKLGFYGNAILGAKANHPCIEWQCQQLPEFVNLAPPWGAKLMSAGIKKYWQFVSTIPTTLVYPYLYTQDYKPASAFPEAYAVHHWAKSWVYELKARYT